MPARTDAVPWSRRSVPALLLLGAAATLAAGCGPGRRSVSPVTGLVVAGGAKKPATGVMVTFHPVRDDGGPIYKPNGYVDEQGRFALTTYEKGDGAPAGEYLITLEWVPGKKSPFDAEGSDLLRGAYADPKKSKIRFTVQSGVSNEVPAIHLP